MLDEQQLKGSFLVAMPSLSGDFFEQSIILLIEHNKEGAFGLTINKVSEYQLSDLIPQFTTKAGSEPVLLGGPVAVNQMFFLHSSDSIFAGTVAINPHANLTSTDDLIKQCAEGPNPEYLLPVLGYAGWAPNQLEDEIIRDAWLVTPFSQDILFTGDAAGKPQRAAQQLGIDLNLVGQHSGRDG
ncbi:MAG: YqgE/AlgH family protein [Pseudomonadota bacterium]|nr:YqgE/AlgH family protein [Pseudomonadota bacterium]